MILSPPQTVDGLPLTPHAKVWYSRALNVLPSRMSTTQRREIAAEAFVRVRHEINGRWGLGLGKIAEAQFSP